MVYALPLPRGSATPSPLRWVRISKPFFVTCKWDAMIDGNSEQVRAILIEMEKLADMLSDICDIEGYEIIMERYVNPLQRRIKNALRDKEIELIHNKEAFNV